MAVSAINIKANAQEVINLRKRMEELKATLQGMRRQDNTRLYDRLNNELQQSTIRYNKLTTEIQQYVSQQNRASKATDNASNSLLNYIKKGAALAGITFGLDKIKDLGSEIINVRNQFQQLEIAFGTMLKSEEKAAVLMKDLTKFAAETPFGLQSAASGAKQLLAYGSTAETVIKEMTMLGDVAAGTGQQLNDLVYLYGTLRTQGRAYLMDIRQFAGRGIPIYDELAKVLSTSKDKVNDFVSAGKVGFKEIEQAFKNMTAQGGLYGGLMEQQSASIGGRLEALKDNIDSIFNQIGKDSEGIIYKSIDGINTLVENYEKVGKILVGLVATYGIYRTALIVNAIATQSLATTQFQLGAVLARVQKIWQAVTATMSINPYVLMATAITGLVVTVWALNDATTAQESAQNNLNKIVNEAKSKKDELGSKSSELINIINSETKSIHEQILAYKELQKEHQKYLGNKSFSEFKNLSLKEQQQIIDQSAFELSGDVINETITKYTQILDKLSTSSGTGLKGVNESVAVLKEISKELEIEGASAEYVRNTLRNTLKLLKDEKDKREEARKEAELMSLPEYERKKVLEEQLKKLEDQKSLIEKQIPQISSVKDEWNKFNPLFVTLNNQLGDILFKIEDTKNKLSNKPVTKNKSFWEKEKKDAEDALALMDETEKGSKEWKKQVNKLNTSKVKLGIWDFSGKSQRSGESAAKKRIEAQQWLLNKQKELSNEQIKTSLELEQKQLDVEQDSFDKRRKQNELNHKKELLSIAEFEANKYKAQQETAKQIYVSETGSSEGFNFATFDKSKLPSELSNEALTTQVNALKDVAKKSYANANNEISKEYNTFIQEERLRFASQLQQQIADINSHYTERLKLVKKGSEDERLLTNNRDKEVRLVRLQSTQKQLEFEAQYNQKWQDLINDRYVFESDKQAASLKQQISDQKKIFNNLEKQVFQDPNNDELARQLREAYIQLKILNKELKKTEGQKLREIADIVSEVANSLGEITGTDLSILSDAVSGIASFASGDYLGAASAGLSIVSGFISGILNKGEQEAQIKRELLKLQQEYNISLRQQNYDLISSIDYARAFRDNLEALYWLVEKGFISDTDYTVWEALNRQSEVLDENILAAQKDFDNLNKKANDILNGAYNDFADGVAGKIGNWGKTIVPVLKDWKNGTIDTTEALRRLSAAGVSGVGDLAEQLSSAKDETLQLGEQIVELSQQMDEFATGNSFDGFLGDAMSAIESMMMGVSELGDFTEDTLKKAVLSSFKYKILAGALEPLYDKLTDIFLVDEIDKNAVKDWSEEFNKVIKEASDKLGITLDTLGLDLNDNSTSQQASSGRFETMSQDTGDALEGRFTAMQMSLISIDENVKHIAQWNQPVSDKLSFSSMSVPMLSLNESSLRIERMIEENRNIAINSYYELKDINTNTKQLYDINDKMGELNKKLN
ncbi:hypothetical protein D0T84_00745 [Dysgonomonas sp. 521]|uniref:tape measure protein n=1 Tax=Dysgonomonas sp. 521 TaxID=2302932 RepID=UPI0013D0ADEB|nr:tape measure protein [Dysgonomonas sp. 521]NDV93445.1 hypothetical protein [Dysgonomonas sp. 521]